jgi:hypothetical protein
MFNKVIKSILEKLKIIEQVIIITIKKEFIFVNIGMIAILTNPKKNKSWRNIQSNNYISN